jgi:diguanylate cyclase (GGDEF)-like protein
MFDLDHFKKINDNYGHQLGNEILEKFGHIIKKNIRHIDAGFRYGGEEFIVIFPLIAAENAMRVAERIRLELEQTRFVTIDKESVTATVSAGIANHLHNESQETLIRRTDKAMYSSKHNGRNRVTVSK